MKKSYIILIILTVFGAGAIALWPTKKESTAITHEQAVDASDNSASSQPYASDSAQTTPTETSKQSIATVNTLKDGSHRGQSKKHPMAMFKLKLW